MTNGTNGTSAFSKLPDEIIFLIFTYIPRKNDTTSIKEWTKAHKSEYQNIKNFVVIYQNFGYACKYNYEVIKRIKIPYIIKEFNLIPKLEYSAFNTTIRLLKNGSHKLAQLHFIDHGSVLCAFCNDRTINNWHPLIKNEHYTGLGAICEKCQNTGFCCNILNEISIDFLCKFLKINNIFENYEYSFINLKIADKVIQDCYGESISNRSLRLRGCKLADAKMTFTNIKK